MNPGTSKKIAGTVAALLLGSVAIALLLLRPGPAEDPTMRLLHRLPADTVAALVFPEHTSALDALKTLQGRFHTAVPGVDALVAEGSRRAGFALGEPETMAQIGLDPAGGTAMAAGPDWAGLWIAVDDPAAFQAYLEERTKRETSGALVWHSERRGGHDIRVVRSEGDDGAPVLALAFHDGHAVVAPARTLAGAEADPVATLLGLLAPTAETSLGARGDLIEPLGRIGAARRVLAWADLSQSARIGSDVAAARGRARDAQALARAGTFVRGLVVGLDVGADAVRLPLAIGGDPAKVVEVNKALSPVGPGPDYARVTPEDALLLVSISAHPTAILPWLRAVLLDAERQALDRALSDVAARSKVDFEQDVLPALSGHVGFAFHKLDLAAGFKKLLGNLGAAANLAAVRPGAVATTWTVGLADPGKVTTLVEEGVARLEAESQYVVEPLEGRKAWRLLREDTEVAGFAIVGRTLLLSTGRGRLERALAGLDNTQGGGLGGQVRVAAARAGLSPDNTVALFLSVPVLLRNFPILNLLPAVARPARQLGELVVRLDVVQAGVDGEVLLTLPPPPAPPTPAAGTR